MRPIRALVPFLLSLAVSAPAKAQVQLIVRGDGSKYVTNTGAVPGKGGKRARGDSDLVWLARQHNRASEYDSHIERWAWHYEVDPVLVRAVIQVESNFNRFAVSSKGARGLMQLMPGTAKRFGVTQIDDPEQNIRGGVAYLATLLRLFPNDLSRVLAAYNAGENAVLRYSGIPPYEETQKYVRRCMSVYQGRVYGSIHLRAPLSGTRLRGTLPSRPKMTTFSTTSRGGLGSAVRSVAVIR